MQLTGELTPLGYAHRETEFIIAPSGPVAGQRIFGCCGPTALASSASAALQRLVTSEQVYALMVARKLCDAQGISDDVHLAQASAALGLSIIQHHVYAGDSWSGWQSFLGWNLGARAYPTLIEVARGQALVDEITGQGENASGLTYHFLMLLKRHDGGASAYAGGRSLPAGYWACDGDNYAGGNSRANGFAASDTLQFYSDATLAAAMPCAAISFGRVASAPPPAPTGGSSMWHQESASPLVMADSNGVKAEFAMAAYLAANPATPDVAHGCSGETYISGETSILPLAGAPGALVYQKSDNAVHADQAGAVLWSLFQQLGAAQAEIATLKAEKNTPAPTPAPAPLTPQQTNDLAVMSAIRTALA